MVNDRPIRLLDDWELRMVAGGDGTMTSTKTSTTAPPKPDRGKCPDREAAPGSSSGETDNYCREDLQ